MNNIIDFSAAKEERTGPFDTLEELKRQLEKVTDDIHYLEMKYMDNTAIAKIVLTKKSYQDKLVRSQLTMLKILSKNKVKKLSARRLADFIRKSYWRISETEKRSMRDLVKVGKKSGYYDRKAAKLKAMEENGEVIPLAMKSEYSISSFVPSPIVTQGKITSNGNDEVKGVHLCSSKKINFHTHSPYDHMFKNSVADPQDGTNLEVEDNFTNGIS